MRLFTTNLPTQFMKKENDVEFTEFYEKESDKKEKVPKLLNLTYLISLTII